MSEWREAVGWEGLYQVSAIGEMRSLKKTLRPSLNKDGYPTVSLRARGKSVSVRVHRIVAKAFLPNPLNLPEVNHLDGVKANNAATNLEWTDRCGNMRHAFDMGLCDVCTKSLPHTAGEKHGNAKLTAKQVLEIRARHAAGGTSFARLALEYGVRPNTVYYAARGVNWSCLGKPPHE